MYWYPQAPLVAEHDCRRVFVYEKTVCICFCNDGSLTTKCMFMDSQPLLIMKTENRRGADNNFDKWSISGLSSRPGLIGD